MNFEDFYEVMQTTDVPAQYQIWSKTTGKVLCICPGLGSLMDVGNALRLRLIWNELKAL
uniref:Uncharacterized protein n=1 Tax=viral metagenome TaxID=1070528 RepID=A0A6M3LMH2_9ZZZZ